MLPIARTEAGLDKGYVGSIERAEVNPSIKAYPTSRAGAVRIGPSNNVAVTTTNAVAAQALAGNGNGGWIYIPAMITTEVNNQGAIEASGYGTGTDGKVGLLDGVTTVDGAVAMSLGLRST